MTETMNTKYPSPVYIHGCGFNSALGIDVHTIHHRLGLGCSPDMHLVSNRLNNGGETVIGEVTSSLPSMPERLKQYDTRNNRLAMSALAKIEENVTRAVAKYGADRVAVVVGTSTSGIADGELALSEQLKSGEFPNHYHYQVQEVGNLGEFIADYFGLEGPAYTVSTACSSSGRVFLSARRLLKAGLADAVIVGGADSICQLTLNGFNGLEALSSSLCNPFSANRNGINIGEAAAFMLLSLAAEDSEEQGPRIALLGAGDSSDAHHISAPHPEGKGAVEAMQKALADAGMTADDIGYINAHGTATPLNDAMESKAICQVFADRVPVSSTKPMTGHTLGAASAVEAAICWHILRYGLLLPVQTNDGEVDSELAPIQLVAEGTVLAKNAILSNSFAFGGNNISLIFGYAND